MEQSLNWATVLTEAARRVDASIAAATLTVGTHTHSIYRDSSA